MELAGCRGGHLTASNVLQIFCFSTPNAAAAASDVSPALGLFLKATSTVLPTLAPEARRRVRKGTRHSLL